MTNPLLLSIPDVLHTERLMLRPPRRGDGAVLHPAIVESIDALRAFLWQVPWVAEAPTPESAEIYCRNAQANFMARKDLPFLMFERSTGRLLGGCGLHRTEWELPKTEVGYWVRSSEAGKGYVSEAVQAVVALAFDTLRAERVELVTDARNLASRRIAERCGFQLEGELRNVRRAPDGVLCSTCIYARLLRSG